MDRRPNILFLLPDQLRPDFLGAYGAEFLATPAIDGLAAQGTLYQTVISPSPICVPARASMLTGQHAHANGVIDNLSWLRPDRREMGIATWPELLGDAGYHTAAIGKMHFYPWDISEGFKHRIIAEDKRHIHIADDYDAFLKANGWHKQHGNEQRGYQDWKGAAFNDLPDHAQVDHWVAGQAAEYLRGYDDDRPFAIMVGFPGPHCPYDPPEEAVARIDPAALPRPLPPTPEVASYRGDFVASYKRGWADLDYSDLTEAESLRIRRHYAASVERLDADVATILAALRDSGRLDHTIVVFASDHGDYLGDFGLMGKTYFHEPSIRVPLIVADFRAPAARRDSGLRSLLDLFPTFLGWAGVSPTAQAHGQTLQEDTSGRVIVGMTAHGVMSRDARHKLVRYRSGAEALYDLLADPGEQNSCLDAPGTSETRHRLEVALARELLAGTLSGHADKRVPACQSAPPHPFFDRDWMRPYPGEE